MIELGYLTPFREKFTSLPRTCIHLSRPVNVWYPRLLCGYFGQSQLQMDGMMIFFWFSSHLSEQFWTFKFIHAFCVLSRQMAWVLGIRNAFFTCVHLSENWKTTLRGSCLFFWGRVGRNADSSSLFLVRQQQILFLFLGTFSRQKSHFSKRSWDSCSRGIAETFLGLSYFCTVV